MKNRSVGIIGSGAVGAYYGALLARAGIEVHFLVRSDYLHVKKHGFKVLSKEGDFDLPRVNVWPTVQAMPKVDLVLVATKTVSNQVLIGLLEQCTSESSEVIILQNGLGVEAELSKALPGRRFFGGLCFLCSTRIAPGVIQHHDYGLIKLAEYRLNESEGIISDSLQDLGSFLMSHGLEIELCDGLSKARWQKLVWNIPFNGLCTVLRCSTDKIVASELGRNLAHDLMLEVQRGAAACGVVISDVFLDQMMQITIDMDAYKPSMLLDFEASRLMEVEDIYWRPLAAVKHSGINLPKIQLMAQQLNLLNDSIIESNKD
jgi:2-dehydropantoate 2-reductase